MYTVSLQLVVAIIMLLPNCGGGGGGGCTHRAKDKGNYTSLQPYIDASGCVMDNCRECVSS